MEAPSQPVSPEVITSTTRARGQRIGVVDRGGDERGHAGLHVGGAAAVEPAVDDLPAERVDTPGLGAQRHGVDMAGEAQRRARAVAQAGDDIGASLAGIDVGHVEARGREHVAEMMGAVVLLARRIDGLVADERLGQRYGIGGWHAYELLAARVSRSRPD